MNGWLAGGLPRLTRASPEVIEFRGILVAGGASLSRKQTDGLTSVAKAHGLGGLALLKRKGDELTGPLSKLEGMNTENSGLSDGDLLLVAAAPDPVSNAALGAVRLKLIELMAVPPSTEHAFLWVDNFPLFEAAESGDGWTFAHHPFTAPAAEDIERFRAGDLGNVRAQHYDLVYNGNELGSGSIRISDAEVQLEVLGHLGFAKEEAERRFGFLLTALRGGAPPHGGMALGFDRIAMLLAGVDNLRDVIAFPKTTAARALFEDTPTQVPEHELAQLGIRFATMTESVTHRVPADGADPLILTGVNDSNLLALEQATGVRVSYRGEQVTLTGALEAVEHAAVVATRMVDSARMHGLLTPDDVYPFRRQRSTGTIYERRATACGSPRCSTSGPAKNSGPSRLPDRHRNKMRS